MIRLSIRSLSNANDFISFPLSSRFVCCGNRFPFREVRRLHRREEMQHLLDTFCQVNEEFLGEQRAYRTLL